MTDSASEHTAWDVAYEWRAIALLTVGFGLVGFDRFAVNILFPAMMSDLHLTYQDLGNIAAAQAITWGLAAMFMGAVSDRYGYRPVIIWSVVVFSTMAGLTGLVTGRASLIAVRALMGAAEGAFIPAMIAATFAASKPIRRGLNFGLQGAGLPIFGLGLGPIVTTQILGVTGSWRLSFFLIALPGCLIAYLFHRVLRHPPDLTGDHGSPALHDRKSAFSGWSEALRIRNIVLALFVMASVAGALNVVIAMAPSYLVDVLRISSQRMGLIVSAIGLGGLFGGIALPALSDRIGRKPVLLAGALGAAVSVWLFTQAPNAPGMLFMLLATIATFGFGFIPLIIGPVTVESSPIHLSSTAAGIVAGMGEIIGGGIAPLLAGNIADHHGIAQVFNLAIAMLGLGVVLLCFLKETRPHR